MYNIDNQQSDVLRQQSLNLAADTGYKFALGSLTLQQAEHYMDELSIRQYEAITGRQMSTAALMNAETTRSLMPHLASMYDEQAKLYNENARSAKNLNDAFDLKVNHNGRLVKSGFALQYTLVNQNRAALRYALHTPDLLKSQCYANYMTGTSTGVKTFGDVVTEAVQDYSFSGENGVQTEVHNYKYDNKGNKIYTGGSERQTKGYKQGSSHGRKKTKFKGRR